MDSVPILSNNCRKEIAGERKSHTWRNEKPLVPNVNSFTFKVIQLLTVFKATKNWEKGSAERGYGHAKVLRVRFHYMHMPVGHDTAEETKVGRHDIIFFT